MKQYKFNLSQLEINKFFKVVREKQDIIEILMESIKFMIINPKIEDQDIKGKMVLYIDDMKRLFFFSETKSFSIVFPFFLKEDISNGVKKYSFYSHDITKIESYITSKVIKLIKDDNFLTNCALEFSEPIYEFDDTYEDSFWSFFRNLLLLEDGYIRYDIDPENYKKYNARGEGDKHPEHHFDVFCSSNATFKIGLKNSIENDHFINFLNINTNCNFLTSKS